MREELKNVNTLSSNTILYYRRRHEKSLTKKKETNFESQIRKNYKTIINRRKEQKLSTKNTEMVTSDFCHIISENNIIKVNYDTTISNVVYNLSIIIPTYKNTEYIDECINSILESSENLNVELLIGIDACEDTLNHIKAKNYPDFIRFYYFNENVGPYLIKNSLVNRTSSDNILFFDSDDIMLKPTLTTIVKNIQKYECVKLKLQNYTNNTITNNNVNYGEGVFAINKQLFLSMNGFEPWRVAADSDFMGRLYSRRLRIYHIPEVSFYYRQHPTSLTKRSDTGMSSQLRAGYHKLSKNKKGSGDPEVLHIANFTQITIDTYEIPKEFDYNNIIRREKLNSVLNPTPRKTIEKPQKKQFSEPTTTRLDELFKNTSNPARIIKTNKPQNRQELIDLKNNTTKKTINELFPKKPNYKEGKNFINVGGKFIK
jgi:glycosyltransferase involved in cell wall biosynthesis